MLIHGVALVGVASITTTLQLKPASLLGSRSTLTGSPIGGVAWLASVALLTLDFWAVGDIDTSDQAVGDRVADRLAGGGLGLLVKDCVLSVLAGVAELESVSGVDSFVLVDAVLDGSRDAGILQGAVVEGDLIGIASFTSDTIVTVVDGAFVEAVNIAGVVLREEWTTAVAVSRAFTSEAHRTGFS